MEKANEIRLFVVIYDTSELLPHFLEYYSKIGVTKFNIGIAYNAQQDNDLVDKVKSYCSNYNCSFIIKKLQKYIDNKQEIEFLLKQQDPYLNDDFIIYCDLDEFIEYPAPIVEIIDGMKKQNIWCIKGDFIDRISQDGTLKSVLPNIDIGVQFPIGVDLTKKILKGCCQKVILHKGIVPLSCSGHHNTKFGYLDKWPIGSQNEYSVHHFKWNVNLLKKILAKMTDSYSNSVYRKEQQRFIDFYNKNNNISMDDLNPRFLGQLKHFNKGQL
jgi:hypothetical protein